MHLFANELSTSDAIRDEVDLGIELPVVCDLANEFLQPVPLSAADADEVDEMLATLLRHTSPSLKLEVAERLAHVSQGIGIERGSGDAGAERHREIFPSGPLPARHAGLSRLRCRRRAAERPGLVRLKR